MPDGKMFVLAGALAGVVMEGLHLFVLQPLLVKWSRQRLDLADYHDLVGNFGMLVSLVAGAWLVSALAKEMVWRGYLMNRFADLFGPSKLGWAIALLFSVTAYGLTYSRLGSIAVLENMIEGTLLAGLYFAGGRNLIFPIVAHGVTDTVDCLIIYLGHYPGL